MPAMPARQTPAPSATSCLGPQMLQQRLDGVVPIAGFDRADDLVADPALAIDHESFRHARNPQIDAGAAALVVAGLDIGVAIVGQVTRAVSRLVLPVQALDGNALAFQ